MRSHHFYCKFQFVVENCRRGLYWNFCDSLCSLEAAIDSVAVLWEQQFSRLKLSFHPNLLLVSAHRYCANCIWQTFFSFRKLIFRGYFFFFSLSFVVLTNILRLLQKRRLLVLEYREFHRKCLLWNTEFFLSRNMKSYLAESAHL